MDQVNIMFHQASDRAKEGTVPNFYHDHLNLIGQ